MTQLSTLVAERDALASKAKKGHVSAIARTAPPRLANGWPNNRIDELRPWCWMATDRTR